MRAADYVISNDFLVYCWVGCDGLGRVRSAVLWFSGPLLWPLFQTTIQGKDFLGKKIALRKKELFSVRVASEGLLLFGRSIIISVAVLYTGRAV